MKLGLSSPSVFDKPEKKTKSAGKQNNDYTGKPESMFSSFSFVSRGVIVFLCNFSGYMKDPSSLYKFKPGQPTPYSAIAATFSEMEKVTGRYFFFSFPSIHCGMFCRLQHIEFLSNLFRAVIINRKEDLASVLYLCSDMVFHSSLYANTIIPFL